MTSRVVVRYKPANSAKDLPAGSEHQAFDAFMVSGQMAKPVMAVAREIAEAAKAMYVAEAFESGETANSVSTERGLMTINGNPRIIGRVGADGGTPPGITGDVSVATLIEYGTSKRPGLRILGRAGAPFDNPKVVG